MQRIQKRMFLCVKFLHFVNFEHHMASSQLPPGPQLTASTRLVLQPAGTGGTNAWNKKCVMVMCTINVRALKRRNLHNTHLHKRSWRLTHLSSNCQYQRNKGGEGHDPSQCVRPVRVDIPVVKFEMFVLNKVQDYRNLGRTQWKNKKIITRCYGSASINT